jgi:hypothetical protein
MFIAINEMQTKINENEHKYIDISKENQNR